MRKLWLLPFVALLVLLGVFYTQKLNPKAANTPESAARKALPLLKKLADSQHFNLLGFNSQDEVKEATLGEPLRVMKLSLEQIKSYSGKPEEEGNFLRNTKEELLFPIMVKKQLRTAIAVTSTFSKGIQTYVAARIGESSYAHTLDSVITDQAGKLGLSRTDFFGLTIPSLFQYFAVYPTKDSLVLIPLPINVIAGCSKEGHACYAKNVALRAQKVLQCFAQCPEADLRK